MGNKLIVSILLAVFSIFAVLHTADAALTVGATSVVSDANLSLQGTNITLNGTGNVGVGLTSIGSKFEVKNNSGQAAAFSFRTNDFALGSAGSSLDGAFGASSGNTYMNLQGYNSGGNGAGNILLNAIGGNVGIGLTNPAFPLDVSTNLQVINTGGGAGVIITGATAAIRIFGGGAANNNFIESGNSDFSGNAALNITGWFANAGTTLNVKFANTNFTAGNVSLTSSGAILSSPLYASATNCSSTSGSCGAAPAGSVTIAAAASTVTVATTAVTANSQILVTEDSSLGTRLGVTCNTTTGRTYTVTSRTAGTSFVVTASAVPATNPACLSYWVVN